MTDKGVFVITGIRGALARRLLAILREEVPSGRFIGVARGEADGTGAEFLSGDLRDPQTWKGLPDTVTHVFHLAAVIPWTCAMRAEPTILADNLLPVARLIDRSRGWPQLKQVIFSSSVSVYGPEFRPLTEEVPPRPESHYGMAKLAGEGLLGALRGAGVAVASLRYSSLYGPRQYQGSVLPKMVRDALTHGKINVFGEGRRTQDFLHHTDAVRGAVLAFRHRADGAYNVASGTQTSMAELARHVRDVFTAGKAEIVFHPDQPEGPGLAVSIARATKDLGFVPGVDMHRGLARLRREMEGVTS